MDTSPRLEQKIKSETTRGVAKWLTKEIVGIIGQAAALFLSSGRLDWIMGWAFVIITALWVCGAALLIIPKNPEILAERARPKKGAKTWDSAIMSIVAIALLACYIVAGLDLRHGRTAGIPIAFQIAGMACVALGYALILWAMVSNAFFSSIARIQKERGHRVATGGPYRFVRHPAYVAGIAIYLTTPIMFDSLWALIPGGLSAILMILRTALEDRMLKNELPGYKEYAERVRYRLIPGVW